MQPEVDINDGTNYKKKYKTLKRKLRMLIYEQECFAEELRRAQRKLLRISRDKSFLLDRLMQYEKPEPKDSDSEATASSDDETEQEPPTKKKKSTSSMVPLTSENLIALSSGNSSSVLPQAMTSTPLPMQQAKSKIFQKPSPVLLAGMPPGPSSLTPDFAKKKTKILKKPAVKGGNKGTAAGTILPPLPVQLSPQSTVHKFQVSPPSAVIAGAILSPPSKGGSHQQMVTLASPTKIGQHYLHSSSLSSLTRTVVQGQTITMTQEELERHLELKQGNKPQFMNLEKTPMLPDNIFSNENSNSCDFPDSKTTDDEDLVIDMP